MTLNGEQKEKNFLFEQVKAMVIFITNKKIERNLLIINICSYLSMF